MDPPRDPRAWLHGVRSRSFLLPHQLPKISEAETHEGEECRGGKDRGQARTPVCPRRSAERAGKCSHAPRPRRPARAPHACRSTPGHGQQSHITDNTQTTPARCTPTHSKTGSAMARLLPTWSGQENQPGPRPPFFKARCYLKVAAWVQAVPAPP